MYVFLAVAPCRFRMGDTEYNLSAGSTFTISEELGEQLRQPNFQYRKYLKLMSKLEDSPKVEEVNEEPKTVELKEEPVLTKEVEEVVDVEELEEVVKPKTRTRASKKVEL